MAFIIDDNLDGVQALRQLASDLDSTREDINDAVDDARAAIDENRDGLGSYADRCEDLLDDINKELADAIIPLVDMKGFLNQLASDLEDYISSNGGGSGN